MSEVSWVICPTIVHPGRFSDKKNRTLFDKPWSIIVAGGHYIWWNINIIHFVRHVVRQRRNATTTKVVDITAFLPVG